jgi:hypothetical protein
MSLKPWKSDLTLKLSMSGLLTVNPEIVLFWKAICNHSILRGGPSYASRRPDGPKLLCGKNWAFPIYSTAFSHSFIGTAWPSTTPNMAVDNKAINKEFKLTKHVNIGEKDVYED